jgi:hypothetical protein
VDAASNINEYEEYFLRDKGGQCIGLTTLLPLCTDCPEIGEPQPLGTHRASPGLYRGCFTLHYSKPNGLHGIDFLMC